MIQAGQRRPGRARQRALLGVLLAVAACSGGAEPDEGQGLSREDFISTFVGLRTAALSRPDGALPREIRDSVLAAHGVSEEELLEFVDIHGSNVKFMTAVWDSVEARMAPADSTTASTGIADEARSR